MNLYTIGYGGRRPKDFINTLVNNNIEMIIDVRHNPVSYTPFYTFYKSGNGIKKLLSDAGIKYLWMEKLGNPFNSLEEFNHHFLLNNNSVALVALFINTKVCLMCAEKDYTKCHRSIITDYIALKSNIEIIHL